MTDSLIYIDLPSWAKVIAGLLFAGFIWGVLKMGDANIPGSGWVGHQDEEENDKEANEYKWLSV